MIFLLHSIEKDPIYTVRATQLTPAATTFRDFCLCGDPVYILYVAPQSKGMCVTQETHPVSRSSKCYSRLENE